MKNKGFTLIELLAVIVVLSIVALIATPIVLNYIEETKIKSFKIGIENLMIAIKQDQAENNFKKLSYEFPLENTTLNMKGNNSSWKGEATISKEGKISLSIMENSYCAYKKEFENEVTIIKINSLEECKNYSN